MKKTNSQESRIRPEFSLMAISNVAIGIMIFAETQWLHAVGVSFGMVSMLMNVALMIFAVAEARRVRRSRARDINDPDGVESLEMESKVFYRPLSKRAWSRAWSLAHDEWLSLPEELFNLASLPSSFDDPKQAIKSYRNLVIQYNAGKRARLLQNVKHED